MFPFSFKKTIQVPIQNNKADSVSKKILSELADSIFDEKPSSFTTNHNQIKFSGGSFRLVGNWNLLTSIDHGIITVVPAHDKLLVSYKLWFTELLIIASLMAPIFGVVILSKESLAQPIFLVVGIWSFFCAQFYTSSSAI
jgi:hypothetical protein